MKYPAVSGNEMEWNSPFHWKVFKCCQIVHPRSVSFCLSVEKLYSSIWWKILTGFSTQMKITQEVLSNYNLNNKVLFLANQMI